MWIEVALFIAFLVCAQFAASLTHKKAVFSTRSFRITELAALPGVPARNSRCCAEGAEGNACPCAPIVLEVDYVVIGSGPAGLAAARRLLLQSGDALAGKSAGAPSRRVTVALLERGRDVESTGSSVAKKWAELTSRAHLLSFAPDMVGSDVDSRYVAARPLAEPSSSTHASGAKESGGLSQEYFTPYPQGNALGGTSVLDWGIYFPPSVGGEASSVGAPIQPLLRLPVNRSPLSWAFAESAAEVVGGKYLATIEEPWRPCCTYPAFLRVDEDSTRISMANYLLGVDVATAPSAQAPQSLYVIPSCTVVALHSAASGSEDLGAKGTAGHTRITKVVCRSGAGTPQVVSIGVRRGVIVCAGVFGTAHLMKTLLPTAASFRVRDAIGLPMVFQAYPGLTDDSVNSRSVRAITAWVLGRKGPFLNPICDTLARVPVEGVVGAEILLMLLPTGGRDPVRFWKNGMNRLLGRFNEAFTILVVVLGLDGVSFALCDEEVEPDPSGLRRITAEGSKLADDVRVKVENALLQGMALCRKVIRIPPLAQLSPQREAIDATLLAGCLGGDEVKPLKVAWALGASPAKMTAVQKKEVTTLLTWANEASLSEAYMRQYIRTHCRWMGFGSGACGHLLEVAAGKGSGTAASSRVMGTANVFIGDCSAVTTEEWKVGAKGDTLAAGSIATALAMGTRAAEQSLAMGL